MKPVMNNKYEIKLPLSMYIQLISCISILLLLLLGIRVNNYSSVLLVIISVCILLQVVVISVLLRRILRNNNNEIEITENQIRINNTDVPIQRIEKIIIHGYVVQSIGIKLYGKRFVSSKFHFRFKNNEDANIEQLKQWASRNKIRVTNEKLYRLI